MTARDFYNKEDKYSVFSKLTSTGISDDLDKITEFAEGYHQAKLKSLGIPNDSALLLKEIREAFADYRQAEGCSCCRDNDAHEDAEKRLAELLKPTLYDDGSGFDWSEYCTER